MLLLAVDTSGRNGSLALARAGDAGVKTLVMKPLEGRMYSAQLVPAFDGALSDTKLTKTEIEAFAVASGPGSFTGLRVGLATVKALSEVLAKPIAAVSVLEAAAYVASVSGRVIVAIDAGRKQVFVGEFEKDGKSVQEIRQALMSWEEFFLAAKQPSLQLFSPDAAVRDAAAVQTLTVREVASPRADTIARIGYEKLCAGMSVPAEVLEANYVRASDAELFSLPKLTQ